MYVVLQKRTAYPTTYCRQIDSHTFKLGYGNHDKQANAEFLEVTVTSTGQLTIVRDNYATLPIFFAKDKSTLLVCNEYADLISSLSSPRINYGSLMESLAIDTHISRPLIDGVKLLHEQETLHVTDNNIELRRPAMRQWQTSKDVPPTDPKVFTRGFSNYLDHFIASRLDNQIIAYEVSGGLDSATLPQYAAHAHGKKAVMASVIFPGKYTATQSEKLAKIAGKVAYRQLTSSVNLSHFPLGRMIKNNTLQPHYYENIYTEAFEPLLKGLAAEGVQVIVRGSGGDELFGNIIDPSIHISHGDTEKKRRIAKTLPTFLTASFRQHYVTSTPQTAFMPATIRPASISYDQLANNAYIRHGIWPVSPFTDPQLYTWCQGLPAHFRSNRNILRAYHQAHDFIEEIYNPAQNEYFDDFFVDCFRSGIYDDIIKKLLQNAVTVRRNYVDPQILMSMYGRIKKGSYNGIDEDCFRIYLWLSAEINAQFQTR